jgi:hypothetical protein
VRPAEFICIHPNGVRSHSPGSRSAPWVTEHIRNYPNGVTSAQGRSDRTLSGYIPCLLQPRVRFATLGFEIYPLQGIEPKNASSIRKRTKSSTGARLPHPADNFNLFLSEGLVGLTPRRSPHSLVECVRQYQLNDNQSGFGRSAAPSQRSYAARLADDVPFEATATLFFNNSSSRSFSVRACNASLRLCSS